MIANSIAAELVQSGRFPNHDSKSTRPLPQCDMGHSFTVRAKYADDNIITYASTSKGEIYRTKANGQLNAYNLHVYEQTQNNIPSLMPNVSEENTPSADANYSEACSTPKKTYSDEKW